MSGEGLSFADYGILGTVLTISLAVIVYLYQKTEKHSERFVEYLKERAKLDHERDVKRSDTDAKLNMTLDRIADEAKEHHREVMAAFKDLSR
jgi:uncharacterized protein YxeA